MREKLIYNADMKKIEEQTSSVLRRLPMQPLNSFLNKNG
jgi:hypothetical protein